MNQSNTAKKNLPWADLCRVAATFGVILIHASGPFFYRFGSINDYEWLAANGLNSLARCSVPLFVMLSGALLLGMNATPSTPYGIAKRISKVIIPLVTWSLLFLYYTSDSGILNINPARILREVSMYHLWFVYMIIGLYVQLPLLQVLHKALLPRRDLQLYFLSIWFVVSCVPIYFPLPFLSLMELNSFLSYGGYFLLGGLTASTAKPASHSTIPWLLVYFAASFITFALTWFLSKQSGQGVETAYLYFSPNVFVASIAAFLVLSRMRVNETIARILMWTSDHCFLIYFMHVVVVERVQIRIGTAVPSFPLFIQILATTFITFLVCLAIAAALRLIPKSRLFLG